MLDKAIIPSKCPVYYVKEVSSTNDEAIKLSKNKNMSNFWVIAESQVGGRGRMGHSWESPKGNLFATLMINAFFNLNNISQLSFVTSLSVFETLKNFININENEVHLKWPNDILVNKKKICGILQEIITLKEKKFLIIGIGLNIESNPNINDKYKATNILAETKKKQTINEIIRLITSAYEKFFTDLRSYNFIDFKKKAESMVLN